MNKLKTYSDIAEYSEVLGASQYRLIQLLIARLIKDINQAKIAIEANDIPKKCRCISSAGNITSYLRECLNLKAHDTLPKKLDGIYEHLEYKLFIANSKNSIDTLSECLVIADNIKAWWEKVNA